MNLKKKKAKTVALRDVKQEIRLEREAKQHYGISTPTDELEPDELLDWLAVIAQEKKWDWQWIRHEVTRRFLEMRRHATRQQKHYDELWNAHYADLDRFENELADAKRTWAQGEQEHLNTVAGLKMQLEELERLDGLRHDAEMRAIRMWQEAHPGNDHVWPDAAKLSLWLMERIAELEDQIGKLQEDNARAHAELLKD